MRNAIGVFFKKTGYYLVFLILPVVWFLIFGLKTPTQWEISPISTISIRGVYFCTCLVVYFIIKKLKKVKYIKIGIELLTISLFINLLDGFILNKSNFLMSRYLAKDILTGIGFLFIIMGSYILARQERNIETDLQIERNLFKTLMDSIPDYIYFKDRENKFVRVNKARAKASGTTPEKMIGKTDFDFFPEKEAKQAFDDDTRVLKTGKPLINKIEELTLYDGKKHWISATKVPWYNDKGETIGTMGISRDITSHIEVQRKLQESEEKFRILAESSPIGVYLIQDGVIKYVNPKASEMFGYKIDELIGKGVLETVIHPDDRDMVRENIRKRINGEINFANYSFRAVKKTGEVFDAEVFGSRIIYHDRPAIIGMIMDVTERKKMEEKLRDLTIKDYLTGLFNYRYFNERIKEQINLFKRYGEVFSLLYIDIDGFKNCNDTYGHQKGDEILQSIGKIFRDNLRDTDSAYRIGGEEFVIILAHTSKEQARKVAERIREQVHQKLYPFYKITVSIGVADSKIGEEVVKIADEAMYEAKRKGKNRVYVVNSKN